MKAKNEFKEWLNSLQVGNYPEVRKQIIAQCKISEQTFRNWKFGTCKIPPLAQEKINEIAKKQVFKTNN